MFSAPDEAKFKNRAKACRWHFGSWILSCLVCLVWVGVAVNPARAQLVTPGLVVTRSRSGQFIIYSRTSSSLSSAAASLQRNTNFVRLDPSLLTVSCERITQLLWGDLGASDNWSGKDFLHVSPPNSPDDPITPPS